MNEFENKIPDEQKGTVSGFDSVNGYYTKSRDNIIQDAPVEPPKSNQGPTYNYTPYPPIKPQKPKRSYSFAVILISCILAAVISAFSATGITLLLTDGKTTAESSSSKDSPPESSQNVTINIEETEESVAVAVAKKVKSSVVGIRTTSSVINFFGGSQEATGEGSGVIYSSDGYIITNYHVIENAIGGGSGSKIEVFIENKENKPHSASVIGYNIASDLAVIKIDATGLTPVELGDSSNLKVGQYVVSIGNPGGLEFMGSVTFGIISGLDREIASSSGIKLIQTDAAINPGNSGGAMLDTTGKLVGINSSKIVAEEYEGMGFAIPVNTVVEKCEKIISRKDNPEAYVGINISETYTSQVLSHYGFPAGAVVLSVDPNSPAKDAGIKRGDIITEMNGTDITDYTVLINLLENCEPKEKITLKIYRSGRYYTTSLTVGSNN